VVRFQLARVEVVRFQAVHPAVVRFEIRGLLRVSTWRRFGAENADIPCHVAPRRLGTAASSRRRSTSERVTAHRHHDDRPHGASDIPRHAPRSRENARETFCVCPPPTDVQHLDGVPLRVPWRALAVSRGGSQYPSKREPPIARKPLVSRCFR
jgi:hypothetical protein